MRKFLLVDMIMRIVTYLFVGLLAIGYLSPYISPEVVGIFGMVGIVMPIIIFINIFIAIYWIIKWRPIAILSTLSVLIGVGAISLLVQMPMSKPLPESGSTLKLMCFNAHNFVDLEAKDVIDISMEEIDSINPAVLFFQELPPYKEERLKEVDKKLRAYKYKYVHKAKNPFANRYYYSAIYSKYRVINRVAIKDENGDDLNSFYVDILYKNDTIRLFNNHLRSNQIGYQDMNLLMGENKRYETKKDVFRLFTIFKKLSDNSAYRAVEADIISKEIKKSPYPTIVAGDFNSIPISYAYRKIRGDLKDSFVENGSWYGYTYKSFYNLLRIDFLFYTDDFSGVSYESPNILWSDHKPLIVKLKYN